LQSPIILPILHRSPDEHSTDKDGRHHDHDEDENDCSCNVHVEEFACFDHIPGTGCEDIVTAQADTGRASGVLLNRALALKCEPIVCRGACLRRPLRPAEARRLAIGQAAAKRWNPKASPGRASRTELDRGLIRRPVLELRLGAEAVARRYAAGARRAVASVFELFCANDEAGRLLRLGSVAVAGLGG
jgi:hypothetical protein